MIKLVAFLQAPWFKPGTDIGHIHQYVNDANYRRHILSQTVTGKRLMVMFGDRFSEVHWDNVTPLPGDNPDSVMTIDLNHVIAVIEKLEPIMVLTLGEVARCAVRDARLMLKRQNRLNHRLRTIPWHIMAHPNKRGVRMVEMREHFKVISTTYDMELLCSIKR